MEMLQNIAQLKMNVELIASDIELREAADLWFSDRYQAEHKYGHISKWDVSHISNMRNLFQDKTDFNEDISDWDVRNVKDMSHMFAGAVKFNQPLYKWKISAGTKRKKMFAGATTYNECRGLMPLQTLDGCLFRNDVPVELRVIIRFYLVKAICPDTMEDAVDLWNSDREQSNFMYGHIHHWNELATFTQPNAFIAETLKFICTLTHIAQKGNNDVMAQHYFLFTFNS
jgi:hypothetical protein